MFDQRGILVPNVSSKTIMIPKISNFMQIYDNGKLQYPTVKIKLEELKVLTLYFLFLMFEILINMVPYVLNSYISNELD